MRQTGRDADGCILVDFDRRFVACARLVRIARGAGYTVRVEA